MDINLMVLNVGNSRLAIGVFLAGELTHVTRIAHDQRADWPAQLAAAWKQVEGKEAAAVVGASVNPAVMEHLEVAVEEATGRKVDWVGREIDLPIAVKTAQPSETGVDRVLTVAAAFEQLNKACVVVDAGTAVTVNFCNDQGEFMGGAIAPGASAMLNALHENTARLPKIEFERPTESFGRDTTEAMRQGIFHALRGLVKETVENYAMELTTWPEVIATGGDAEKLFGGWELIHAVSPDLALYGIALAYTNHHIKNEE